MSVEVVRGGQRRIDRVLDPRFVAGVGHEGESVSTHRRAVLRVVDLLRGELAGRYRDGGANVSQLLRVISRSARRTQVSQVMVR
jgi:hypothetical protein